MSYHKALNEPATPEQLERAKERLKALADAKVPIISSRFPALENIRESIAEARLKNVSYRAIAQALIDLGITVTKEDVQEFCWRVLKETRHRRSRSKRAKKATKEAQQAPAMTRQNASTSSAGSSNAVARQGFRVGTTDL